MRLKHLIFILPLIFIALVLVLVFNKPAISTINNQESPTASPPIVQSNIQTTTQTGTFFNFLRFVVPQSCTFSSLSPAQPFSGTIYLDNGRIYSKISITNRDLTIVTNLIYVNNTSYTWTDNSDTGFKLSYKPKTTPLTWGEIPIDPNLPIQYTCEPWNIENIYFSPPKNIKYADFAQYIRPTILPSGNTTKCEACDSLGDISKQVCLISLNCK